MSKLIQMPKLMLKGNDQAGGRPSSTLGKPVLALPGDAAEDRSGLAQIERWLELADAALATPAGRKRA